MSATENKFHRTPDYILKAKAVDGREGRVGAIWVNPSGNLSVKLDPFISLTASEIELLTGFPKEREAK